MIAGVSRFGIEEIPSEAITSNGYTKNKSPEHLDRMVDGLRFNYNMSRVLQAAHKAGVMAGISVPRAGGMLWGISTAVRTGAKDLRRAVVKDLAGIHVGVSHYFKSGILSFLKQGST